MKTTEITKKKELEEEYLDIYMGEVRFKKGYRGYDDYVSDLAASIRKDTLEEVERNVIGGDESERGTKSGVNSIDSRVIRNDFRAEQRKALTKLKGEADE